MMVHKLFVFWQLSHSFEDCFFYFLFNFTFSATACGSNIMFKHQDSLFIFHICLFFFVGCLHCVSAQTQFLKREFQKVDEEVLVTKI